MRKLTPHMVRYFAVTTITPMFLLALGSLNGGFWAICSLGYMTALAYSMDFLVALARDPQNPEAEFPSGDRLSIVLALGHFVLLGLVVWALSASFLNVWERVVIFLAHGYFFGQVSNSNAHELIHRSNRFLRNLGMWVYISLLFGHHTSAHPKVHHPFVSTPDDPNSPPRGMSYYRFLPRAWLGSFRRGLEVENALRARSNNQKTLHPYIIYLSGALCFVGLAWLIGGFAAVWRYIALSLYASSQLMLSDYVQHYGLVRKQLDNGKYEPVSDMHSWNAPKWFTSLLMLNAPRHSDHHAHPRKPYVALEVNEAMPCLPRSLPVMATLALIPPLWFRIMNPRVDAIMRGED